MASSSRQSDEVRVANLLKCLTLKTTQISSGPDPSYTPHSWVKCEIDNSASPDRDTKSTCLQDDKKPRRKSKSGLRRSSKSSSAGSRSPRKRNYEPHRTCKSAQPSKGNHSPRTRSPGPERTCKSAWPWNINRSPRTCSPGPERTCKSVWPGNRSPRTRIPRLPRTSKSARPSHINRSPRTCSPGPERACKSARPSHINRSPRTSSPGPERACKSQRSPRTRTPRPPRTFKSSRPSYINRSPRKSSPQRNGTFDAVQASDNNHCVRSNPVSDRNSGRANMGSLSPRKISPVSKRTCKSVQPLVRNRFPWIETATAPSKPNSMTFLKNVLTRSSRGGNASTSSDSAKTNTSVSENMSLTETASSCRSRTTDSTRSGGSTVGSISEIYSGSSKTSRSALICSSSNTTKSMGSTTVSSSDSDGGSSKTYASSLTYGTSSTTKSRRSIAGSSSDIYRGSSKTSGSYPTTDTGTMASAWATVSSVERQSNISCLVHGPSTASVQNGQLKCDRCIKRPVKTRMDRQEPVSKKTDGPSAAYPAKKQQLVIAKETTSAYLQVSVVPVKLSKTIETLVKERESRLRRKNEIARMMLKRESRMNDICRAYDLSRPYLYRPFLSHLFCLRQSQPNMDEYLHNVQAVVQSLERRDNLKSLPDMRAKRDTFYRTTKIAAWKALHIQDGIMPSLDILRDSDARASFMVCRKKIEELSGPRPKATVSSKCTFCRNRRYCSDKQKAKIFRLKAYRWQKTHMYSIPYMVKAIERMNQALKSHRKGRRNFAINKHLRTVYIVRKLFYSYREEFREQLKLFLMEHANNLDNSTMRRRWTKFLMTRKPTEKAGDIMALNCALDICPELKCGQHVPDCDVCENLKEAIRNAKRDIAKIKENIIEITRDKKIKTRRQTEVIPESEEEDESSKAKKAEKTITVIMPSTEEDQQSLAKMSSAAHRSDGSISLERVAVAKEIVANVYRKLDEGLVKGSFSDTTLSWHYIDKSEIVERIVSDVLKRITEPSQDDVVEDVYPQGALSETMSVGNIAERVVSDVLKRINDQRSTSLKTVSFSDATTQRDYVKSDTHFSNDDLADNIVMYVLKRISEQQSKDAVVQSLGSSSSDTASQINEEELASKVVSDILRQLDVYLQGVTQSSLSDTKSDSDNSFSLFRYFKSDSSKNILVERIVSDVLKRITKSTSEEVATSQEDLPKGDTSYDVDELADKITMHVLKQIAGQQSKDEIVESLLGELSDAASQQNQTQCSASLDENELANKVVSRILRKLDDYLQGATHTSLSDTKSQSDRSVSHYQSLKRESLSNIFVERIVSDVLKRIAGPQSEDIATSLKDLVTSDTSCTIDELAHKITIHVLKQIVGQQSKDDFVEILARSFTGAATQRNLVESSASLDDDRLASRIVSNVLKQLTEQESKPKDINTKGGTQHPLNDTLSESGHSDSCNSLHNRVKGKYSINIFVERIVSDVLKRITESRSEGGRTEDLNTLPPNDATSQGILVKSCTSYNVDDLADEIPIHVLQQITEQRSEDASIESLISSFSDAQSGPSFDEDELVNKIVLGVLKQIAEGKSKGKDVHLQGGTQRSLSDPRSRSGHSDSSSLLDKTTVPKIYIEPVLDECYPSVDNVKLPKIFVEPPSDNTDSDQSISKTSVAYEPPQGLDTEAVPDISGDAHQDSTTTAPHSS